MFLGKFVTVSFKGDKKFFGFCIQEDERFLLLRSPEFKSDTAIAIKQISTVTIQKEELMKNEKM